MQTNKKIYKTIIPGLVTLDTSYSSIPGFYLSSDFDYFPPTSKKGLFHYVFDETRKIQSPLSAEFRNGYYYRVNSEWFYERKQFGLTLKFSYDSKRKIFLTSKIYSKLPFELGGILPVGRQFSDVITLDLFLSGYDVFRGCCFEINQRVICVIGPSFNGKTSLMNEVLNLGGVYLADDVVVLNNKTKIIYPAAPLNSQKRDANQTLKLKLYRSKTKATPVLFDDILFLLNRTKIDKSNINPTPIDFFILTALIMNPSLFIQSYIFKENLTDALTKRIKSSQQLIKIYKVIIINNFNFQKILNEL